MTDLRDKDIAVLQAIQEGASDTAEIKQATTLTNREINYSLTEKSLEKMGLVRVERPEGREWREFNGTEKYTLKPKQVRLTNQGIQKLTDLQTEASEKYEDMSQQELITRVNELENRQDQLETVFKDFRQKVMERI